MVGVMLDVFSLNVDGCRRVFLIKRESACCIAY